MTLPAGLDFLTRIVEALAWPSAVVFLGYHLREPIISLLQKRGGEVTLPGGGGLKIPPQTQPEIEEEEAEEAARLAQKVEPEPLKVTAKIPKPEVDTKQEGQETLTIEEAKRRLNVAELERENSQLKLELFFERTLQWIFGSQLSFMYELAKSKDGQAPLERIIHWYVQYQGAIRTSGQDPLSIDNWLHYLEGRDLIEVEQMEVDIDTPEAPQFVVSKSTITELGKDFVEYCQKRAIRPDQKPY